MWNGKIAWKISTLEVRLQAEAEYLSDFDKQLLELQCKK
jgi:hypothetical protein